MAKSKRPRSAALRYVYDRYIGANPERIASVEQERVNVAIAQKIYDLRTKAGLTHRELAERVGISASAVCQLEDADYEGHSLSTLRQIAQALGQRVEIRFVPVRRKSVLA